MSLINYALENAKDLESEEKLNINYLQPVINELQSEIDEYEEDISQLDESYALGAEKADELRDDIATLQYRLDELRDLQNATENSGDAVNEEYFKEHAQEIAEELNTADMNVWPMTCIDWENATDELRSDYTYYKIGDTAFYVR